ncbi:hypothetical protein CRENBAI_004417 [Crenichthys baileyi]|uniref:Uncharacterized protein n=1 Tax=Crenichthys baileyi TaxID=28760 RepID=A0AAV9QY81_9TELE
MSINSNLMMSHAVHKTLCDTLKLSAHFQQRTYCLNPRHGEVELFVVMISKCDQHDEDCLKTNSDLTRNEAEGDDSSGVPLESEMCKKYLKTQITEDSIIIPAEDTREAYQVDPFDEIQTDLRGWVSNICKESSSAFQNVVRNNSDNPISLLFYQLNKGTTREVPFVSPDISVLMDSGMAQLDTSVENGLFLPESPCLRPLPKESECPVEFKTGASISGKMLCAGTVTHSYSIGDRAWIDTDLANTTQFPLSEFPPIVALQGKTFTLRFYRGRSLKPGRPLPLARMMVGPSEEIPLTSSHPGVQYCFCSSKRDPWYST